MVYVYLLHLSSVLALSEIHHVILSLLSSHDFIGEFTTSYKELCRGQSQSNVYEVSADTDDQFCYRPLCFLSEVFHLK